MNIFDIIDFAEDNMWILDWKPMEKIISIERLMADMTCGKSISISDNSATNRIEAAIIANGINSKSNKDVCQIFAVRLDDELIAVGYISFDDDYEFIFINEDSENKCISFIMELIKNEFNNASHVYTSGFTGVVASGSMEVKFVDAE